MKTYFCIAFILLLMPSFCFGASYTVYVDVSISDTHAASATPDFTTYNPTTFATDTGSDSVFKTVRDVNAFILSLTNGTDDATIYFRQGQTWTMTSNSDILLIKKSSITIDAFGSGAKPILDGDGSYPTGTTGSGGGVGDNPYNYGIMVGCNTAETVTDVSIKNIKVQNMYPGGGILFSNDGANNNYTGAGLVSYVDVESVGWAGIYIYEIYNSSGSSGAIKIEGCDVSEACEWPRINGWSYAWPNAVGGYGTRGGHEARYNYVHNCYGEGIGATTFNITELNVVTNTKSGSIYSSAESLNIGQIIIRYNLVFASTGTYPYDGQITINDEKFSGSNASADIQIYGNIVIGGWNGLQIKNVPTIGTGSPSPFGSVKAYNNTFIDNYRNIVINASGYDFDECFSAIEIINNASVIYDSSNSTHLAAWGNGSYPVATVIGPNFYHGDGYTSETQLPTDWRDGVNVFGDASLGKTSGWRSLAAIPDLDDFTPQPSSDMLDNPNASDLGDSFDEYIANVAATGFDDPSALEIRDQDNLGDYWDFGAIVVIPPEGDLGGNIGMIYNVNAGSVTYNSNAGTILHP